MTLNAWLKSRRQALNYTQQAVAEAIYGSRTSVRRYEAGTTIPGVPTLAGLFDLFGVPGDDVLCDPLNVEVLTNIHLAAARVRKRRKDATA